VCLCVCVFFFIGVRVYGAASARSGYLRHCARHAARDARADSQGIPGPASGLLFGPLAVRQRRLSPAKCPVARFILSFGLFVFFLGKFSVISADKIVYRCDCDFGVSVVDRLLFCKFCIPLHGHTMSWYW
jgi:hypothetical protein